MKVKDYIIIFTDDRTIFYYSNENVQFDDNKYIF